MALECGKTGKVKKTERVEFVGPSQWMWTGYEWRLVHANARKVTVIEEEMICFPSRPAYRLEKRG